MQRMRAIVAGRVQGVGYREFVRRQAQTLGLAGWVRNRPNETVEVVAEGDEAALARLLLLLEQGPAMARVDDVQTSYAEPGGELSDFRVRW